MNEKRARETQAVDYKGWTLEPHVCRSCFGRITSQRQDDGSTRYRCSNCGLGADGHKPSVVCACGIKVRKYRGEGRAPVLADAGIRCHANKARTPEFPAEYVCSFGGAQSDSDS